MMYILIKLRNNQYKYCKTRRRSCAWFANESIKHINCLVSIHLRFHIFSKLSHTEALKNDIFTLSYTLHVVYKGPGGSMR